MKEKVFDAQDFKGTLKELVYELAVVGMRNKRPFGNSGFECLLAEGLHKAGMVKCVIPLTSECGKWTDYDFDKRDLEKELKNLFCKELGIDSEKRSNIDFY